MNKQDILEIQQEMKNSDNKTLIAVYKEIQKSDLLYHINAEKQLVLRMFQAEMKIRGILSNV